MFARWIGPGGQTLLPHLRSRELLPGLSASSASLQFERFLRLLATICATFATLMIGVAVLHPHDARLAIAGAVVGVTGLLALWARSRARHGHQEAIVLGLPIYALFAASVTLAALLPRCYPIFTLPPLFAVAAGLPYREAGRLRAMPAFGWATCVGVVVIGETSPLPPVAPSLFLQWLIITGVGAASFLVVHLLVLIGKRVRVHYEQLRFLADAGRLLNQSLDSDEVVLRAEGLAPSVPCEACVVDLVDDRGTLVVTHDGRPPELVELAERVLRAQTPAEMPDGTLIVPLVSHETPIGVITFVKMPRDPFQRTLAEKLALSVAVAVDNARLYQTAQHAIRFRDEFLTIASHQLKTPLTVLSLQMQRLRRMHDAPEEAQLDPEALVKCERSVRRLRLLVNQLLDVSRISEGKLQIQRERIDLGELVRGVVAQFSDALAQARVEVRVHIAGQVVGRWDRLLLEEVTTNLISNALKYGRGRPIEVGVAGTSEHAILTVRDSGVGIPADKRHLVFRRFERLGRQEAGFGLGLWIVRRIVTALGGTITFESAAGQGTRFKIQLPYDAPVALPVANMVGVTTI